jgi:hypothetical protein
MFYISNSIDDRWAVTAPQPNFRTVARALSPKNRHAVAWAGQALTRDESVTLNRDLRRMVGRLSSAAVATRLVEQIRQVSDRLAASGIHAVGKDVLVNCVPRQEFDSSETIFVATTPSTTRPTFQLYRAGSDAPIDHGPHFVFPGGLSASDFREIRGPEPDFQAVEVTLRPPKTSRPATSDLSDKPVPSRRHESES